MDMNKFENKVNAKITLTEYHDLRNISEFQNELLIDKMGNEIVNILNKYQIMGSDKIALMKNITLQLISQGVKQYLKDKKEIETKKMQDDLK